MARPGRSGETQVGSAEGDGWGTSVPRNNFPKLKNPPPPLQTRLTEIKGHGRGEVFCFC